MADEFDISGLRGALGVYKIPKEVQAQRDQEAIPLLQAEYRKRKAQSDPRVAKDLEGIERQLLSLGATPEGADTFDISGLASALKGLPSKTVEAATPAPAQQPTSANQRILEAVQAIPGAKELGAFGQGVSGAISTSAGALQQLLGKAIPGQLGERISQSALQNIKQTQQAMQPVEQAYPTATTAGQVAGYIANPMNKLVPSFGGPAQTLLGGAAKGAGQGAVANVMTTPVTDENQAFLTEKLKQAAVGATGGAVVGGAVQGLTNVAQPFKNQLSKVSKDNVEILRQAGVPVDVAQATGSPFLNRTKAALSDNPFTVGKESEFAAQQQAAYNKAIAKTMGEDATAITPDVLSTAKERLGSIYDDLFQKYGSKISGSVYKNIANIRDEAERVLPSNEYTPIKKMVDDILDKASLNRSSLSGDQYQAVKSALDKMSASSSGSANYARELKDALLEGLTKSAEAAGRVDDIALLKLTNKQYGNMKKIEDVVLKDGQGNVSAQLLSNSLATKAKRHAIFAEDAELAKLARAGKDILQNKTPNSGTIARLSAQAAPALVGGAMYGLYEGDIPSAIKGAAAGYLAPKGAQMVMRNPSLARYLEQGVAPGPARTAFELPQTIGQLVPPYAAKPGAAGGIGLRELVNLRNQQAQ
jgi:hypothetical protein